MSQLKSHRRQVPLYVPRAEQARIEGIRQQFNSAQFALIAAHVTLFRDEDVHDWSEVQTRASEIGSIHVPLRFGPPVQDGDLVYLPALGSTQAFDELRIRILNNEHCRNQEPHITLVHPRNGTCTTEQFDTIRSLITAEFTVLFQSLTFIEQVAGGPWHNLHTFPSECDAYGDITREALTSPGAESGVVEELR